MRYPRWFHALLTALALQLSIVAPLWAQSEVSFTRQDFGVGDRPSAVTVGDFNGDGRQDLATANGLPDTVSILLGQGDGTFSRAQDIGLGVNPGEITVGDFNGDGRQDLATGNAFSDGTAGSVSILLGQGDGAFEPARDFAVAGATNSVSVGDFNSDGRQDLAAAAGRDSVSILLGNGDGTFSPAQDIGVSLNPVSTALGDFNGDGRQDLATASLSRAGGGSILLGQGDGTFEAIPGFAAGESTSSVTVGDFNSDGRQDLATANSDPNTVSILLGNGDGTFSRPQDVAVGESPVSITVGDFNGDRQQDLATANNLGNAGSVSILLGQGDGTFELPQDFAVGEAAVSVTVGDFNGDGQRDVATANSNVSTVSVLINSTAVEIAVKIDIKPGSFPNSINPKSKGVIPVAILTADTFDASTVDPTTVFFGATGSEAAPAQSALKDVNGDGNTDLLLHFRTQRTGIECGDTSASLTGETFGGQAVEGSDSIRTVGCQ